MLPARFTSSSPRCPAGFSGPTTGPGWDVKAVAEAWAELMSRLGFDRYLAQGGDWGNFVSTWLGLVDPEHLAGIHLNMAVGFPGDGELTGPRASTWPRWASFSPTAAPTRRSKARTPKRWRTASPTPPPAWPAGFSEKFWAWTDHDGNLFGAVSEQAILDNLTSYWVTGTIGSSARIYFETCAPAASPPTTPRWRCRQRWRSFPPRSPGRPAPGWKRATTWSAIPASTGAGTSQRWKSRIC